MLGMQHNVVNLLYTIKGFVEAHLELFQRNAFHTPSEALEHAQDTIKKIYAQADRAIQITRQISLVMRTRDRSHPCVPVSVKDTWQEVAGILKRQYPAGATEFIDHIPQEFPRVLCRPRDLRQVLYCLAENAVQAMSAAKRNGLAKNSGGHQRGKLIVRANLGFSVDGNPHATVTLADTGPGIPEEILYRVFEPFVTTKAYGRGSGLGLCLVKGLTRKNGGTISVASFKGCGTTFILNFPIARPQDKEAETNCVLAADP